MYSIFQVFLNVAIVSLLHKSGWLHRFLTHCHPDDVTPKHVFLVSCANFVNYSNHKLYKLLQMETIGTFYYFCKFFDLFGGLILAAESRFKEISNVSMINEGYLILTCELQALSLRFYKIILFQCWMCWNIQTVICQFPFSSTQPSSLFYIFVTFSPHSNLIQSQSFIFFYCLLSLWHFQLILLSW